MKLILSVLIIFCALPGFAQNIRFIKVAPQNIAYAPQDFYLQSGVVDDRADKTVIGNINDNGRTQALGINKGAAACFSDIIANHIKQNRRSQPITLHITKLNFDVKKVGDVWKIEALASFTFYAGDNKLLDFNGKGQGETGDDPGTYVETFIRQTFENDLKRFDGWWDKNKGNVVTSSKVKVNVTIGSTIDVPNTIVYDPHRPLQYADFQGPPEKTSGPEMAATLSGMGFSFNSEPRDGQLVINVTITPYFDKSGSWFKEGGKTPRLLAHEQAHFDITAIKACELATTIQHTGLTAENYKAVLDRLEEKSREDSNTEENTYDDETNHGTINDKQMEWSKKVKDRIRELGCYN